MYFNYLEQADPELAASIRQEISRQEAKINMTASEDFENYKIMEAIESTLTNKHAEEFLGKPCCGEREFIEGVEQLTIDRACKLFGAEYANVRPYSELDSNTAAFQAVLDYGDTVLGIDLFQGRNLVHGFPVNISSKSYNFVTYGLVENETIDYDDVRDKAKKYRPKLIVASASAYPRAIDFKLLKEIADEVGAMLMADIAHIAGLVAVGLYESPIPYADVVTTTTHSTLCGPRGGMILCREDLRRKINAAVFLGTQGGSQMHTLVAKAICLKKALEPSFKEHQQQVIDNAQALVSNMINHGFELVSGGTDNHLILVKLLNKGLTGNVAERMLNNANIITNKNSIPNDSEKQFVTSGLRMETPAITSRGFKAKEVELITDAIALVIDNPDNTSKLEESKAIVRGLTDKYPLCTKMSDQVVSHGSFIGKHDLRRQLYSDILHPTEINQVKYKQDS